MVAQGMNMTLMCRRRALSLSACTLVVLAASVAAPDRYGADALGAAPER